MLSIFLNFMSPRIVSTVVLENVVQNLSQTGKNLVLRSLTRVSCQIMPIMIYHPPAGSSSRSYSLHLRIIPLIRFLSAILTYHRSHEFGSFARRHARREITRREPRGMVGLPHEREAVFKLPRCSRCTHTDGLAAEEVETDLGRRWRQGVTLSMGSGSIFSLDINTGGGAVFWVRCDARCHTRVEINPFFFFPSWYVKSITCTDLSSVMPSGLLHAS
ncbi:hypothetical protein HD554DRAFT_235070 [Boletus coccyginus]|nr:hypothetical protein HD554DRAFT_235070 [Boletus coccyginus]